MLGFTTTNEPIKGDAARIIREHIRRVSDGSVKRRTSTNAVYHVEGGSYDIVKG